jgi:hypothetical protein
MALKPDVFSPFFCAGTAEKKEENLTLKNDLNKTQIAQRKFSFLFKLWPPVPATLLAA